MATRTYRMTARAATTARTRQAILDAAHRLFAGDGFDRVAVDDVAAAAGVARATVYHHFGSRSGLIEALTTATDEAAGYPRIVHAATHADPAAALHDTLVEAVAFIAKARPLFDNLRALAYLEEDTRRMVERKDAARRDLVAHLVTRAADADVLHPDTTPARAAALLNAVSCYEAIRELLDASESVDEARHTMSRFLARLTRSAPDTS